MSMERDELHRLIDEIPEDKLPAFGRLLKDAVEIVIDDPVRRALANAPFDDEPESEEERKSADEADADLKAGRTISMDELKRELDL